MDYPIREDDVSKGYYDAITRVIDIRKERRLKYGDSFDAMSIDELFTIVKLKLERYKAASKLNKNADYDDLLDVVNYMLFIIINLENGKTTSS